MLVLTHEFPPVGGGASPVACEIAKGYAQRGHTVSVVTMGYGGLPEVEHKDSVEIFRVKCLRRHRHICTVPEMLTFVLSARRFLRRHLRTRAYDVVHAHFIVPGGALALWAKRAFAVPYVVTSHGSDVLGYNPRFRLTYPLVSRAWSDIVDGAQAIAAPSRFLADRIRRLAPNVAVATIPHAVDTDRFCPLGKEKRILIAARLIEVKGVQDVVEALAGLDLGDWAVDIIGEGLYRRTLERQVADRGLSRAVTFHGWIDNDSDRIRQMFGRAGVFVSASHCENMSTAILEALAAGCRVVVSDAGGSPELVAPASLFEARNIPALRDRLATAMRSVESPGGSHRDGECRLSDVVRQYEDLCFT